MRALALFATLLLASVTACWGAGGASPPPTMQTLCSASFASSPQGPWQEVALPDTWAQRGIDSRKPGHYRLQFDLPSVPDQLWAVRAQQLSPRHEMRLNGQLVSGDMTRPSPTWTSRPGPKLVVISPGLLHSGTNTLEITAQHPSLGGLSCLSVGPNNGMAAVHGNTGVYVVTIPLLLNAAAFSFALFIGVVWLRHRPNAPVPVTVPLIWALASGRHIARLTTESWISGTLVDWAYYANTVVAASLCAHLAYTLGRRDDAASLRRLYSTVVALLVGGALASTAHQLPGLRAITTPLLILQLAAALVPAARVVYGKRDATQRALFNSLALISAAWTFDYACWLGYLQISTPLAMPYVVPLSLALLAWALLQQLVLALAQVQSAKDLLEHRVEQRTRDLQLANAAKSRFLTAASHDLRQPVVTIGLLVGLLREQLEHEAQRQMIDRVDEAVASMETFLGGLLDLSRFEAGTVTPQPHPVALQGLFDAVAAHSLESARLKGLKLRFRPTRLAVRSDPLLLEQILRNLVSNALRYTHRGGVLVAARARGPDVWLQVWDTGIGIAPEQQSAVFEELIQLDNPGRESSRGYGLGLAIVQRAAGLLGHRVHLRSQAGRGSCFMVGLPRTRAPVPQASPPQVVPQPLAGLQVVVVDDDPAVLAALTDRLRQWGALVHPHASLTSLRGVLAATVPRTGPRPDLLVTDQRLPDGSGLQAAALMRRHHADLPVLVITGNTQAEELALLQASHLPVLHKPFRAEALLAAIQRVLRPLPSHAG